VPLTVRSSLTDHPGTSIEEDVVEETGVVAVAHRSDCSIVIAEGTSGGRGEARGLIAAVADAHPELELIAHEQATDAHGAVVWIGSRSDAEALEKGFRQLRGPGGEWKLDVHHGAAFVSLIGPGLGAEAAVRAEAALERAGIGLVALRTTPAAMVLRVESGRGDDAARALHAEFIGVREASARRD
jgi:aspartokinase